MMNFIPRGVTFASWKLQIISIFIAALLDAGIITQVNY